MIKKEEREDFLIAARKIFFLLLKNKELIQLQKFIDFLGVELTPEEIKKVTRIQLMEAS